MIRSTRLIDLVHTMDPELVAVAFGMGPPATVIYLADRVDWAGCHRRNRGDGEQGGQLPFGA